ncbi:hypothetical protein ACKU27_20680 [Sphingobium yanoikuyae]|uniref:hypothetical protein n=1 Tax=Sphingobium yanoikuyae TaxID=13690 RepID=UPI003B91D911
MARRLNDVELAQHRMLVALFIDATGHEDRWIDRARLKSEYNVDLSERLFTSIAHGFKRSGWVELSEEMNDGKLEIAVFVRSTAYARVQNEILDTLGAKSFDVNYEYGRITTDARPEEQGKMIPCRQGWLIMTIDREESARPSVPTIQTDPLGDANYAARDIYHVTGTVNNNTSPSDTKWTERWPVYIAALAFILTALMWVVSDQFPWNRKVPTISYRPESQQSNSARK